MREYRVRWSIDITATSAKKAARIARRIQLDPKSMATYFEVVDMTVLHLAKTMKLKAIKNIDLISEVEPISKATLRCP